MIRKIILLFSIVTLISCGNEQQKIEGKIEGGQGQTLYLIQMVDGEDAVIDSTVIGPDDQFSLTPHKGLYKDFYRLELNPNDYMILITDSTEKIHIDAHFGKLAETASIEGSNSTTLYVDFSKSIAPKILEMYDLDYQEAPEANGPRIEVLQKEVEQIAAKWLDGHSSEPGAVMVVQYLDPAKYMDVYLKIKAALGETMSNSEYYQAWSQFVDQLQNEISAPKRTPINEAIAVGKELSDISLPDVNGKIRKISDLRGKVVLVDCWASWCGPCRKANPEVVSIYNQFQNKGFEIFSISLDSKKEAWLSAIQQDHLNWPNHVSDLKGWDAQVCYQWGINSIPYPILLDKKGVVVAHGADAMGIALKNNIEKIIK